VGIELIAALSMESPWVRWPLIVLGLGMVIFIHELGHFLVAKLCGVKCEKFFIGFDIYGLKISKKWGETEYGIGILPLGGYVKMLGQDDNPYKAREEMERAKAAKERAQGGDAPPGDTAEDQTNETPQYDPRSYLAQSVPKRMAIISAGVIMNVIFAFVVSVWAYSLGVKYEPPVIGTMVPGDPAWKVEPPLQPGDEIIEVNGIKEPRFTKDLQTQVIFADLNRGVPLLVKRPGETEPFTAVVYPEIPQDAYAPMIGLRPAPSTILDKKTPTTPGSAAADAKPAFQGGDRIVAIDGQEVDSYAEIVSLLADRANKTIEVTVERPASTDGGQPQRLDIVVAPNPMQRLGLVMKMGEITAIRPGSPAAAAGMKPGQRITRIVVTDSGREVPLDPIALPLELRQLAGSTVDITVVGENNLVQTFKNVPLEAVPLVDGSSRPGAPQSAPSLGVAYRVLNRVSEVIPGSPAAKSNRIKPDDEITSIRFILSDSTKSKPLPLGPEDPNWPYAMYELQAADPRTQVELTVKGQSDPVILSPEPSDQLYLTQRGFRLQGLNYVRKANSFGEAIALGARETWESLTMVVQFLRKVGRQISFQATGGPLSILTVASVSAERGFTDLLIFLAMLSANLAVINSLPIPVLDGGHFLFLLLEGIRGKPVSERLFIACTYMGFLFLLSLMAVVMWLDVMKLM